MQRFAAAQVNKFAMNAMVRVQARTMHSFAMPKPFMMPQQQMAFQPQQQMLMPKVPAPFANFQPQQQFTQLQRSFMMPQRIQIEVPGVLQNEELQFTSVLRKRRTKMNRHKLKKRRKRERFSTRKSTKE
eukprot:UN00027